MRGPIDFVPLWALFLLTTGFVLLVIELGFRLGRRRAAAREPEKESPVGAMVGASLGLLAFLLAFTFGFAASRFEARRTVLLDEVNAIGTAWLRAGAIPDPPRSHARALLREYAGVRLEGAEAGRTDEAIRRSLELQSELWEDAAALAAAHPNVIVGLYLQALNAVIDLHTKRVTESLRVRVPLVIWLVLYTVTALAMTELGYQTGLAGGRRRPLSIPALALSFASVILLIADLDRPQAGLVRVSQQSMLELIQSMEP